VVPAVERLEQEAKLAAMRQPADQRLPGTTPKYQSQAGAYTRSLFRST
jgi:hypothetical protein